MKEAIKRQLILHHLLYGGDMEDLLFLLARL